MFIVLLLETERYIIHTDVLAATLSSKVILLDLRFLVKFDEQEELIESVVLLDKLNSFANL